MASFGLHNAVQSLSFLKECIRINQLTVAWPKCAITSHDGKQMFLFLCSFYIVVTQALSLFLRTTMQLQYNIVRCKITRDENRDYMANDRTK